jgi:hypothetical protein
MLGRPKALAVVIALVGCRSSPPAEAPPSDAAVTIDVEVPDVGPPDPNEPPVIPVGYDALRMWDRWPSLRIGMRATMRSTFDRSGGNHSADAAHFIRQRGDGAYVALDLLGTGTLSFVRTNHWHGSPWHYIPDGVETIVRESSTADPLHPVAGSTFLPADLFPPPLALTWSTTKGADLSWVSIPFRDSIQLAYERGFYGTGYYIVQRYGEGTARLSHPIESWDRKAPPSDVLELVSHAGDDLAPTGEVVDETLDLGGALTAVELAGARSIRALRLTAPSDRAIDLGRAHIRVTWDGRSKPSIDAPIALFFGAGTLYRRTDAEWLVKSFPAAIRFPKDRDVVELSAYWPMPFFASAKIEIVSDVAIPGVKLHLRSEPYDGPKNHVGYLHATFRDHATPTPGQDLLLLDTAAEEGSTDWCGHFVGTSFQFSDRAILTTLEGDPRFFFDDSLTPQGQGTGTEEWGGGGDYWGGENMTLPFAGHPVGAPHGAPRDAEDGIESAYRFLLSDLMPFGKNARIQLEHGGEDNSDERYRTVTFWYGTPSACLVRSDELHVGDEIDEAKHHYVSPLASAPEAISSRYEWGVDFDRLVTMKEVIPVSTDTGRHTSGTSEFTLAIPAKNFGVMLRRKFDQSFVDQRAEVFIAEDRDGATYEKAGVWFHAGSNTALYGATGTEVENGPPQVQTSNRRFREEELLLPRRLTEGRAAIRVRIVPVGAPLPLKPGDAAAPRVWSEIRYWSYAWTLPTAP